MPDLPPPEEGGDVASTLTAPTNAVTLNNFNACLNLKCHIYYSLGYMDPTTDTPTSLATLLALYTGATPKFKSLGEQEEEGTTFEFKRTSRKVLSGTLRGKPEITGTIKSAAFCPEMLTLLDGAELDGVISLLFVPLAQPSAFTSTDPGLFLALNGVKIVDEGKGNAAGKDSGITLNIAASPNKIKDVIKMAWLTS
jgi:hypothetical protein